ncbi:YraN family protein [Nonlabens xiamenensis]|uniref:YraN family protein n=1 Tax=Nonlabens xiamenensis TaxID=2341043 RepID=UPI000F6104BB|nr:YraN family protein [Nonlabens xiamenensis]
MADHNILGTEGEDMAASFVQKEGYDILKRNYTYNKGEIDIIARKNDIIAIIEVKTRSTPDFGDPQTFLKPKQIKKLIATADHYVQEYITDNVEVRFDIVAIIRNKQGTKLEHIKDAFYHF